MRSDQELNTSRKIFPSGNVWGIPDLLPDQLAGVLPGPENPFLVYRTARLTRAKAHGGILGFFVDDYRFVCAWSYPSRMVAALAGLGLAAVCEPDFSLWADDPRAEQLHAVYRSRWVARYWQECGLHVIPSLNWSDEASFAWAWAGLPVGVEVAAVECRSCGSARREFNAGLAAACEVVRPRNLIIYGPVNDWVSMPSGVAPVWVEPPTNRRFRALHQGQNNGRSRR
jgi:hypothetical protein